MGEAATTGFGEGVSIDAGGQLTNRQIKFSKGNCFDLVFNKNGFFIVCQVVVGFLRFLTVDLITDREKRTLRETLEN